MFPFSVKTRVRESTETGSKKFICEFKTFLFWKNCNAYPYSPYGIRSYSTGYSTRQDAERRIQKFLEIYF